MQVVGVDAAGDGAGDGGGVGGGDLGAGAAEGDVEVAKDGEGGQEGPGRVLVGG